MSTHNRNNNRKVFESIPADARRQTGKQPTDDVVFDWAAGRAYVCMLHFAGRPGRRWQLILEGDTGRWGLRGCPGPLLWFEDLFDVEAYISQECRTRVYQLGSDTYVAWPDKWQQWWLRPFKQDAAPMRFDDWGHFHTYLELLVAQYPEPVSKPVPQPEPQRVLVEIPVLLRLETQKAADKLRANGRRKGDLDLTLVRCVGDQQVRYRVKRVTDYYAEVIALDGETDRWYQKHIQQGIRSKTLIVVGNDAPFWMTEDGAKEALLDRATQQTLQQYRALVALYKAAAPAS